MPHAAHVQLGRRKGANKVRRVDHAANAAVEIASPSAA